MVYDKSSFLLKSKFLSLAPDSIKTIVGVVDDIHEGSLESPIWPAVYQEHDVF